MTAEKLSLRERGKIRVRAELLDAVLELFLDEDPNALNVEAVARQAGCAKATVYSYFPNGLNEMLCALYLEIGDEVYRASMKLRQEATTTHGRIMAVAKVLMDTSARPRRGKFYAQLNPALSPALQPVLGRSSSRSEVILTEDLSGELDRDARAMATLLIGALREASVATAKDPGRKDEFLGAFEKLLGSLTSNVDTTGGEKT